MTQLQISLSESANQFVEEQVATGRYPSASEYLADLVEKAREKAAAQHTLAELVREGMESGEGEEVTDEWWQRFDEKLRKELERRRSA
jgi:antitoxin ParD1/3/4